MQKLPNEKILHKSSALKRFTRMCDVSYEQSLLFYSLCFLLYPKKYCILILRLNSSVHTENVVTVSCYIQKKIYDTEDDRFIC